MNKLLKNLQVTNIFYTCASWIFIEFPLALASDNFPFQTLLRPLYSYLLSRKLESDSTKQGLSTTQQTKEKCGVEIL